MFLLLFATITFLLDSLGSTTIKFRNETPGEGFPIAAGMYAESGPLTIDSLLVENKKERQSITDMSKQLLSENLEQNVRDVHIVPMPESKLLGKHAKLVTPYKLGTSGNVEKRSLSGSEVDDLGQLVRYLLARQGIQRKNYRPIVRQVSSTTVPLPTVDTLHGSSTDVSTQATDITPGATVMSSTETSLTYSSEPSDKTLHSTEMTSPKSTYSQSTLKTWSPSTTELFTSFSTEKTMYPTKNPDGCTDTFVECKDWLNDYYDNNLPKFCLKEGYDSWCCETCYDWESSLNTCKDDYEDCGELLENMYHDDYDTFCATWKNSCCATCLRNKAEKPPSMCVDVGYEGLSCEHLLQLGVNGDIDELCWLLDKECCHMCSDKHKGRGKAGQRIHGGSRKNG